MASEFLGRLRNRPERERKILGISVYVAIAAISIALWVGSVRHAIVGIGAPETDTRELPGPLESIGREISQFTNAAGDLVSKTASLGAQLGAIRPGNPDVPVLVTTSTPPATDAGQASVASASSTKTAPSAPRAPADAPAPQTAAEPAAATNERSAWASFSAWITNWFGSDESYNR
ncbi:hypothetical protein C4552_01590 [Candidatus Parcubacteria bacterium]|nr:MAG: hypothetical protein C4552_01590 [Candidatus Parcubacteria bacterium]